MHRVLAALVAVAMLSTPGSTVLQHVHAYVDHDHADHHHGPASHGHSAVAHSHAPDSHAPDSHALDSHAPDDAARLEGCDPGEHAVSVVFTYVAPQLDHVLAPVTVETIIVAPRRERGAMSHRPTYRRTVHLDSPTLRFAPRLWSTSPDHVTG